MLVALSLDCEGVRHWIVELHFTVLEIAKEVRERTPSV